MAIDNLIEPIKIFEGNNYQTLIGEMKDEKMIPLGISELMRLTLRAKNLNSDFLKYLENNNIDPGNYVINPPLLLKKIKKLKKLKLFPILLS
ncbi:hypothetical protein KAI32_00060 [Candidatus Pacearchaeota archaeon]|nr:hypothetical protein [Candidatus Pacearchaeota archaeon]